MFFRELTPGPLANNGLELISNKLWCSPNQVWKLSALSNVTVLPVVTFVKARKGLLWSVEEMEHLADM